jgi:putative ABC transport system permease protein
MSNRRSLSAFLVDWIENLGQDIRYGVRGLRKNSGFTAVAVLTLALGIGATTAIFSMVNAVLLKALPYQEPDRLVMLWTDNPSLNLGFHELPPTQLDLPEWRNQAQSFDQIAAFKTKLADLSDQGDPERVGGVQVTANFFSLLGVQPLLGRVFATEEEKRGKHQVAIISHELWQRRFGGEAKVLGQLITLNHERYTLIGVMPPGFSFPRGTEMPGGYALMPQTEVWVPYAAGPEYWRSSDSREYIAIGRLKAGVTLARAQTEMTAIAQRQAEAHPKTHAGWTVHLRPFALQVAGQTRPLLLVLLGAVAFVLLIACANIANLLLARSSVRRKEIAVRSALGAGRGRILRQLLTESILLALLGGGMGLLLGAWGVRVILAFSPPNIPRLNETTLDGRVFLFSLFISLATGIIFGLAPAWHAIQFNLSEALNADNRSSTAPGRHRTHGLLVIAEVALAVVLLTGAALMIQSLRHLLAVDPGFKSQRIAAFDVGLNGANYDNPTRWRQFYRAACERLRNVPGVRAAAAISNLPLGEVESLSYLFVEGTAQSPEQAPLVEDRKITPGYFTTMGVSWVRGRDFTDNDGPGQPNVCIINKTLARKFYSGLDPIGKRLKMAKTDEPGRPWLIIVGIADDVRSHGIDVKPRPQIYTPVEQNTDNYMTFIVGAEALPGKALEGMIRTAIKAVDPTLPAANFRTMERLVSNATARPRFSTFLLGLFAATALALTVVGLYGVVAYAVSQRTREIGIRIALGAGRRRILALIVRQGMSPALFGLAIGVLGAFALTRLLASQLYEVKPTDPLTFFGVIALLLLVTLAACLVPARRAAKVDPVVALRYE